MLISALADLSGTPAATIKYYVREGLLPAGAREGGNRTSYDDTHLHRLRLIRALLEVGKLSIGSVSAVLEALDDEERPIAETFETAQNALSRDAVPGVSEPGAESFERADGVIERAGWAHCGDNVGRRIVAQTIDAFAKAGHPLTDDYLDRYAEAAATVASADLDAVGAVADRADRTELMVVGTVLGDTLSLGLRRIAQAHRTAERNLR
ncbi:MerR family transcriptional regulator [Herbiconiux sp. VKM Ac-2851]|jgi:DNA-binding transcriptional MerR regulator|uniref:MerR family transcriptional regulator n=1 Tax=Herbiconiux sp. VKM Ac-2851 TaxID=2739025 RepID=UPI001564BBD6|nr:MerR family transcriptional regulator [Herbiconiux sp. VKM Ac-2851]NQX36809.1 MerR family transcriptional regulator [Herbiconiux sp. VKM Ac-2851]